MLCLNGTITETKKKNTQAENFLKYMSVYHKTRKKAEKHGAKSIVGVKTKLDWAGG